MTDKVWQTNVYSNSHERLGTYYFRNLIDLERSVRETWARDPKAIRQLKMDDLNSKVWVHANDAVAVEATKISISILNTWTHF